MSHSVELHDIGMTFGQTRAVGDVSFTVEGGEAALDPDTRRKLVDRGIDRFDRTNHQAMLAA